MGVTIGDMDIERERKDNKIEVLDNKEDYQILNIFEEMKKLELNKLSSEKR